MLRRTGKSTTAIHHGRLPGFKSRSIRSLRPALRGKRSLPRSCGGFSLTELLVAATLSIVVSGAALAVMGNTLGASTHVVQATRLSQDLRRSLQIMTRDVRRAGYTSSAMWCLGNTVCLPDATINLPVGASLPLVGSFVMPSGITINGGNNCFTFELDRNHDGTVTDDEHGAYRRRVVLGIGRLQMWIGAGVPDCDSADADWVELTDPNFLNVTVFQVDDDQSFSEVVATDLLGNTTTQRVRRVRLQVEGRLVSDDDFTERIEDTIDVRNDILL